MTLASKSEGECTMTITLLLLSSTLSCLSLVLAWTNLPSPFSEKQMPGETWHRLSLIWVIPVLWHEVAVIPCGHHHVWNLLPPLYPRTQVEHLPKAGGGMTACPVSVPSHQSLPGLSLCRFPNVEWKSQDGDPRSRMRWLIWSHQLALARKINPGSQDCWKTQETSNQTKPNLHFYSWCSRCARSVHPTLHRPLVPASSVTPQKFSSFIFLFWFLFLASLLLGLCVTPKHHAHLV